MTARDVSGLPGRQVALIDLLDRLLSGGVVLTGDLVLSIADVDLVRISLRAVIVAVGGDAWALTPLVPEATVETEGGDRVRPLGPA
ncbi:gas vesicle protein [Streptomyces coeruleoprunus]|uniref:Gas vesicle protein n=1 Tax=Streptomyces coeruleoprunus TaxID=285563 RepID=A0ABV9X9L2_9ACTN